MIRTIVLIGLLAIMIMVARNNPGVLPEAARSAGTAIETKIRDGSTSLAEKVKNPDLLPEILPKVLPPSTNSSKSTQVAAKPSTPRDHGIREEAPMPSVRNQVPPSPLTDDQPIALAAPRTPVQIGPAGPQEPAMTNGDGSLRSPPTAVVARPSLPPVADTSAATTPSSVGRVESLLRDAARILAETEVPR